MLCIKNLLFLAIKWGWSGRVVRWCWVNFQCLGVLQIWILVGQGPTVLTVRAGGVIWTFFLSSIIFLSLSLSLRDSPILTEVLSQRAIKVVIITELGQRQKSA